MQYFNATLFCHYVASAGAGPEIGAAAMLPTSDWVFLQSILLALSTERRGTALGDVGVKKLSKAGVVDHALEVVVGTSL